MKNSPFSQKKPLISPFDQTERLNNPWENWGNDYPLPRDTNSFDEKRTPKVIEAQQKKARQHKEFVNLFNYQRYYETEVIKRKIKELLEVIKKEIEAIKQTQKEMLNEVKDIEKEAIGYQTEKPGVYHINFLEIVIRILRQIRAKVGESKTWLSALISKKKKRGSLFAVRAKKMGTQYSLSQELQLTRSVQ